MGQVITVCGYGSGISHAVATKFGKAGFDVALIARRKEAVEAGAKELAAQGVKARGFSADLADFDALKNAFVEVKASLGSPTVIHWNAYAAGAGTLEKATHDELMNALAVSAAGVVFATQLALPDLKAQKGKSAVLVTGGGFSQYNDDVDRMLVDYGMMGLGIAKAAQHKAVRILHHKLAGEGVYVGEVMVLGMVKGTAFDNGHATIDPERVADAFFERYEKRDAISVPVM